MYDKGLINGTLYIDGAWVKKNLYIKHGLIEKITDIFHPSKEEIDASGMEILPGIIDPHVHFELDLGSIRSVDDFHTGSIAAAYGGVTSIIDFLDPVDHVSELEKAYNKRLSLAQKSVIDYAFHATIKKPRGNLEAFVLKMKSLGIDTLKLFTTYSDSGRRTDDDAIVELLTLSKKHDFLLLAHIENDELIHIDPTFTYKDITISRPTISETIEALKLAEFTRRTEGNMYMVHLSSGRTLEALKTYYPKLINTRFYIESCPQYFSFTSAMLDSKNGRLFTLAPPLRSAEEQALLFKYADDVHTIGTDHCSFMKADKDKLTLADMPLGIGGVEHALPVMRYHLGDRALDKMTRQVAKVHRMPKKGALREGFHADIVVYDPHHTEPIKDHHGAADHTVYEGHPQSGRIISTMVRGNFVIQDRKFIGGKGRLHKEVKNHA